MESWRIENVFVLIRWLNGSRLQGGPEGESQQGPCSHETFSRNFILGILSLKVLFCELVLKITFWRQIFMI